MRKAATISDDGKYRYSLLRYWNDELPRVCFIMLNPSTADADIEDPTTRRVLQFSKDWGFGSYEIVNLFALRSPAPELLRNTSNPIGGLDPSGKELNDLWILAAVTKAKLIVVAWGTLGGFLRRDEMVCSMIRIHGREVHCVGKTKGGFPGHPLYLPKKNRPVRHA